MSPILALAVEDAVRSFDNAWLLPPIEGEIFESGKAYLARLQGFALSRGFAVVTTNSRAGDFDSVVSAAMTKPRTGGSSNHILKWTLRATRSLVNAREKVHLRMLAVVTGKCTGV